MQSIPNLGSESTIKEYKEMTIIQKSKGIGLVDDSRDILFTTAGNIERNSGSMSMKKLVKSAVARDLAEMRLIDLLNWKRNRSFSRKRGDEHEK